MSADRSLLLISGSVRAGSTNAAVLTTATLVLPEGVSATIYDGLARLPHFNPDDDVEPLPPAVAELRAAIASADAIVFSTPEYAGALPGSFKNLLDWTVGGGEIYEKPVAWINVATSPTGAANAYESLRIVLGYAGTRIVDAACAHIPVPHALVDERGLVADATVKEQVAHVITTLVASLD